MPPQNTQNPYEQNNNTPPPPPQPEPVPPTQAQPPMPPSENPVQPNAGVVSPSPQVVSPSPAPQPMQQPGMNPAGPSPSVQQPMQPSQPGPVVIGGPVVGQGSSMPNQAPGMINAAPGMPGGKPKKNIKKLVITIAVALVAVAGIAFGAMTIMKMLTGGAVNFSKLETATGEGYTIDVPKDYGKLSESGIDVYFYTNDKKENDKIKSTDDIDSTDLEVLSLVVAGVQEQKGISGLMKAVIDSGGKQELVDRFQTGFADDVFSGSTSDFISVDNSSVKIQEAEAKDGELLSFTGTFNGTIKNKAGEDVKYNGNLKFTVQENDKIGVVFAFAEQSIYDKQKEGIENSVNSFKAL